MTDLFCSFQMGFTCPLSYCLKNCDPKGSRRELAGSWPGTLSSFSCELSLDFRLESMRDSFGIKNLVAMNFSYPSKYSIIFNTIL